MTGYTDRYVAYIDILGFREIVARSQSHPHQTASLPQVLKGLSWRPTDNERGKSDFQFQSFSDSIVASTRATDDGLVDVLNSIARIIRWLLMAGMMTRGGIAKGPLVHEGEVMFGPAFIEAWQLEQALAKFPRVLFTEAVHQDVKRVFAAGALRVAPHDDDGPPYLDVLSGFEEPSVEPTSSAQLCQDAIQRMVDQTVYNPDHFAKARWLALKWNGKQALVGRLGGVYFPWMQRPGPA